MSGAPSPQDLAQIAAKLDPSLAPDEAITRARELWEVANRASRADEIADEVEKLAIRAEAVRLANLGLDLFDPKISISEAFEAAMRIAERMNIPPYKTEKRFAIAMRKADLTILSTVHGKTLQEWIESAEPDMPITETHELTSVRATEELFKQKADKRKKADRKRKAASKTTTPADAPREIFKKVLRKARGKKMNAKPNKRKDSANKRKSPRN